MSSPEFSARRRLLLADLASLPANALLVCSRANVRYLCGFTGSTALLLLSPRRTLLLTDPRYEAQAAAESDCPVKVVRGPLLPAVARSLPPARGFRLAFEKAHLTFEAHQLLERTLPSGVSLVPAAAVVENRRLIKSESEIAMLRLAARTNCDAFARTVRRLRPGMREADVAAEIEFRMRKLGAEGPSFETIVAAGPRSALPHARAGGAVLEHNQLLLIDMGATRDGYASDMTRMIHFGRPSARLRRLHSTVLRAQLAALEAVRDGVTAAEVDRAARRVLRKEALERAFIHSTGHGLGLEIHEPPRIGRRETIRLRAGMAITIEPGVYLRGFGGIRIEDTVIVTRTGCEILTSTPKELLVL